MKIFVKVSLLLCGLFISQFLQGQILVKSELIKHYSVFEMTKFRKGATKAVDAYKIWYKTLDINSELDTASGLLLIPSKHDEALASVLYQHGTTDGPQDCPSNLKSIGVAMNFAAEGYLCSVADYLGLGESRGFHPYLHAESQASAAIDMFYAAKAFCKQNDIQLNDSRFVSGYSQGGHAAMALYKMLEENPVYGIDIDAVAGMSGPYSLSGVGVDELILKEENYTSLGFLPYIVLGLQEAYGNLYDSLEQIFLPIYIAPIKSFRDHKSNITTLTVSLWATMSRSVGNTYPKNLFTPEVIATLESKDESSPLYQALIANDLFDWKPEKPVRMYYCEGDKTVTYRNSIVADSVMNEMGAIDVKSQSANQNANHSTCADYAVDLAIDFFDNLNLITSNENAILSATNYDIKSNLALDEIILSRREGTAINDVSIIIYDIIGNVLYQDLFTTQQMDKKLSIQDFKSGNYILRVLDPNSPQSFKFIKL